MRLTINGFVFLLLTALYTLSCKPPQKNTPPMPTPTNTAAQQPPTPTLGQTDDHLLNILKTDTNFYNTYLANALQKNIQIVYSEINRRGNNQPKSNTYYFNNNPSQYFYPASTVKLPVAILALQKLKQLSNYGVNKNTTMLTQSATPQQTMVFNDATTANGKPTIAHYIKKILLVSDNDAYNRLYEFLGQEYINTELQKRGYQAEIVHRLSIALPLFENAKTNPITFVDAAGKPLFEQGMLQSNYKHWAATNQRNDSIGKAYYAAGKLVNTPMNFSYKNKLTIADLHTIIQSITLPETVPVKKRFDITEEDRQFLLQYMSQLPTESNYPPYADEPNEYWPAYCKFLYFGSQKGPWPKNIRMFNKVGDAYGHLIDATYFIDVDNGIEFYLSAIIYANADETLNDDKYDYDNVGFPFMQKLGQIIYQHELKRVKTNPPNLSNFIFTYDK
jgi:hypothetical protein